ncbi:nicotinate phosphoribosyltransferase, partial [Tulasnella sp. 331]
MDRYDYLTKRQDDAATQPTQVLPYWLSASTTTIPNPTFGGTAIVTVAIVDLPLTYYGPSIPLGTNWVYGGSASPASIYVPPSTTETPTITPAPTPTPSDSVSVVATPATPALTSSIPDATSSLVSQSSQSAASVSSAASISSMTPVASISIASVSSLPVSSRQSGVSSLPSASSALSSSAKSTTALPATTPPGGSSQSAFPAGAIVGTVIGGILALLGLLILICLCIRRRRRGSQPTRHSSHGDTEAELGYAEGSSLLSGRLAGGESPPPQSPALSTASLGPAVRSRTPLSTRRFPYSPIGAGAAPVRDSVARHSPPMEAARASSDIHHRSETIDRNLGRQAPPEITIDTPRTTISSRRFSQRLSPTKVGATAVGLLGFFGLRKTGKSTGSLGSGWEPVTPPAVPEHGGRAGGPSGVGLGIRLPQRTTSSKSDLTVGGTAGAGSSSQPHPSATRLESNTYASNAKSKSTVSGLTNYWDAPSRPGSPPPALPSAGPSAGGLGAAAAAGALAAREMSQKDRGLVSQRSTPLLRAALPPQPSPRSTAFGSPPTTSNPFENSAYNVSQRTTRDLFDDVLDSPAPVGLLPPGLEQNRGLWSRENVNLSSPILEDDEEEGDLGVGVGPHEQDALLDDAPPARVGAFPANVGGNGNDGGNGGSPLTGVVAGGLAAAGISQRGRLRTSGSPGLSPGGNVVRGESQFSVRTGDSGDASLRPWSGQLGQARRVQVAGVAPVTASQYSDIATVGRLSAAQEEFLLQHQQQSAAHGTMTSSGAPITTPGRGPGDWTTDLGMLGGEALPQDIPENLQSIYEWFRANPVAEEDPAAVIPSSPTNVGGAGSGAGGLRIVPQRQSIAGSLGGGEFESSGSEYSSLLRTLRSVDRRENGSHSGGSAHAHGAGPSGSRSPENHNFSYSYATITQPLESGSLACNVAEQVDVRWNSRSALSSPHYVQSILDTDLSKLTMQQAVQKHFPDKQVIYKFINRSKNMNFTRACANAIQEAINHLKLIKLQDHELLWLKATCPYFQPDYLEYLAAFRFKPKEQITLRFVPQSKESDASNHEQVGDIEMEISGLWGEVILYETPVMAIVSEAYFVHVDKDWTMDGQEGIPLLES